MGERAILVHGGFLAAKRSAWDPGCKLYLPEDQLGGITPVMAAEIEAVACAGDLPNAIIDALPNLRLVASFATGYGGIDLAHLRERDIRLTSAAGINAHDVADHAIALLLAWWHGIPTGDRMVRSGEWRDALVPRPSLRGRRAGVVGLGRIGSAIARRLAAHDIDVQWWGPRAKPASGFTRAESLLALAQWSDILVVASRAVPENAGQINRDILHALGPSGVLVNISRGFLVDETTMRTMLRDGKLGGAALDVFADEPPAAKTWAEMKNVVLSPHLAGFTREAGVDMFGQLRENLRRHFAGEPLLSPVNDHA
ncbi:MAG: 2-hydroxyacid dehydrogenase [Gammaproteobacteria bacterium]|nr:2-hydroxyacid dehydrogenase [Gammaproteobacteria bacterium]